MAAVLLQAVLRPSLGRSSISGASGRSSRQVEYHQDQRWLAEWRSHSSSILRYDQLHRYEDPVERASLFKHQRGTLPAISPDLRDDWGYLLCEAWCKAADLFH